MKLRVAAIALCLVASGALSAHASPIYLTGNSAGTTTSTVGAVTFADFDLPVTVDPLYATITGGTTNAGTGLGQGNWLSASSGNTVTITFTGLEDYFGMYWGTRDGYNQINLFNGATLLYTINGPEGGGTAYYNITAGNSEALFDRITLVSNGCCFEVDNLAVREAPVATPEPASLLLLGTGIAAVARRRFANRA